MAVISCPTLRISVPVGNEEVVFVVRRPSAQEISRFLSRRVENKRNKMTSRLYEAREEFANSIIQDVEGAEYISPSGETLPLNAKVEGWLDMVPLNLKTSVAMFFEDVQGEEAAGN